MPAALARGQVSHAPPLLPEAKRLQHAPGVALVLSGGGLKGFAHIGVLDVLDSAHVPIDLITGTSIGAVVGGLFAAGYTPKQLEKFAESTDWADVLGITGESNRSERSLSQKDMDHALLSLRFTGFFNPVIPQAISNGERLTMLLNEMVLNAPAGVPRDFLRDLHVPFIAVTTDIVHGTRELLTKGDLTEALRESATLPLRFSPLPGDSEILMDGGLLSNIPADVARSFGASRVIVSNATAGLHPRDALNTPWDVADQVITLMMLRQNARELKLSDCTITPNVSGLDENDYSNIPAMIEAGREAARAMLPKIEEEIAAVIDPAVAPSSEDTLLPVLAKLRIVSTKGEYVDSSLLLDRSILGMPLIRSENMKTIEQRVLRDYRSRGYSLVRIDSVVLRTREGRADLYLDEGRIARIAVHGEDNTDTDFVLRELAFNRGDIFRARAGEQSLQNLTGTGLFDFAILQISYDTLWPGTRYILRQDTFPPFETPSHPLSLGPTVILTVHSESPNVLRLGALADNEFGAEFSAELANENIGGSGMEYSLIGSLGSLARSASLYFGAPRLFHGFGVLDATFYSGYRDINVYSLETNERDGSIRATVTDVVRESQDFGVRLRAGGQVERLGAITLEMRAEHQRWSSLRDSAGVAGDDQLRALRAQLLIDSRDDADYPHSGTFVRGYVETGLSLFGSGTNYTKLFGEVEQAIPISALHTLVPRLRLGFGDLLLPRLEAFDLGGMESFYGLNEYELRGKQMIEGSLTYQIAIPHALYFPTYVAARYDVGAIWPEPAAIKFESLLHGIGAQVGVKTPLGRAQFGMGENFRFVNVPGSNPLIQPSQILALNAPHFYFSIGAKL